MKPEMAGWHRQQAIVLASQLPDNIHDARLVLEAVRGLVDDFLAPNATEPLPENVLALSKR